MKRDRSYLSWIRSLPCAVLTHRIHGATPCFRAVEAHHPQGAGLALKSADHDAFPMCGKHHTAEFHSLHGTFKGWTKEKRKVWERQMSEHYEGLGVERKSA